MAAPPRSSSFGSRLGGRTTILLWVVAGLFAASLTAVLLLRRDERDEVSAYIRQVNDEQQSFAVRFGSINQAYEQFRLSPSSVREQLPRLLRAARLLTSTRRDVAAIAPPTAAQGLRRRLIELLSAQEAVAYELVGVVAYLPKLEAAERPVARANARLAASLRGAETVEEQGVAVGRYARTLRLTADRLETIDPPPLLAPSHRAYVAQLRRYGRSATSLQRAVASGDNDAIAAAGTKLREASAAPSGTSRAQRRAIQAYNERIAAIRSLANAVERERLRLDAELG